MRSRTEPTSPPTEYAATRPSSSTRRLDSAGRRSRPPETRRARRPREPRKRIQRDPTAAAAREPVARKLTVDARRRRRVPRGHCGSGRVCPRASLEVGGAQASRASRPAHATLMPDARDHPVDPVRLRGHLEQDARRPFPRRASTSFGHFTERRTARALRARAATPSPTTSGERRDRTGGRRGTQHERDVHAALRRLPRPAEPAAARGLLRRRPRPCPLALRRRRARARRRWSSRWPLRPRTATHSAIARERRRPRRQRRVGCRCEAVPPPGDAGDHVAAVPQAMRRAWPPPLARHPSSARDLLAAAPAGTGSSQASKHLVSSRTHSTSSVVSASSPASASRPPRPRGPPRRVGARLAAPPAAEQTAARCRSPRSPTPTGDSQRAVEVLPDEVADRAHQRRVGDRAEQRVQLEPEDPHLRCAGDHRHEVLQPPREARQEHRLRAVLGEVLLGSASMRGGFRRSGQTRASNRCAKLIERRRDP